MPWGQSGAGMWSGFATCTAAALVPSGQPGAGRQGQRLFRFLHCGGTGALRAARGRPAGAALVLKSALWRHWCPWGSQGPAGRGSTCSVGYTAVSLVPSRQPEAGQQGQCMFPCRRDGRSFADWSSRLLLLQA